MCFCLNGAQVLSSVIFKRWSFLFIMIIFRFDIIIVQQECFSSIKKKILPELAYGKTET